MSSARSYALIPMKRFEDAKSRLRGQLPDAARGALAQAMFERVLGAAQACSALDGIVVLTNDDEVARLAQRAEAHVLRDRALPKPGLGGLLDDALTRLPALGATRAIVLMADLPYLEALDIACLVEALEQSDMAIVADARGTCTNALAAHLPMQFATAFGDPQSYLLHTQSARAHGLRLAQLQNARIAHDVDTRDDLPRDAAWAGGFPLS
jgi:2-phospho-L-lactate/phosphoenolpyruvate guanylyltransferase